MAIGSKIVIGKKVYEGYVNGFDLRSERYQQRRRGIERIRKAEEMEFEFARELAHLRKEGPPLTWSEWFRTVISRMEEDSAASTVINYEASLGKWVNPNVKSRRLDSFAREVVYKVVFEEFDQKFSPSSRRTLLKQIRRVFQMAVNEGLINRNPTTGIKVQVPEVDQKVLTKEEVRAFLAAGKATNPRIHPIWLMALMTGMRSGELFALTWKDVDFEACLVSVSNQWTNKCGYGVPQVKQASVIQFVRQ